jgi:hypothetical protein
MFRISGFTSAGVEFAVFVMAITITAITAPIF